MTTKHAWVSLVYEIQWECEEAETFHEDYHKDFPLTKNLSDWLCDLTYRNIADNGMVEHEWHILHKTPGHIFVLLTLFSDDLSKRIQYPFTEPENWKLNRYHLQTGPKHGYLCTMIWSYRGKNWKHNNWSPRPL